MTNFFSTGQANFNSQINFKENFNTILYQLVSTDI